MRIQGQEVTSFTTRGILFASTLMFSLNTAAAQTAVFSTPAGSPIQILALSPSTLPANTPQQQVSNLVSYQISLKNICNEDVVAYAISWAWETPGQAARKGTFSSFFSADPFKEPVLRAGQSRTDTKVLVARDYSALRAAVDFAMLADGTAYGANASGTLQEFQQELSTTRSIQRHILGLLQSQGADKVIQMLRDELANEAAERRFLQPKRMGEVPEP